MEKIEVKRILSAPISFVREATTKEAKVFADKKNAWFYTFGLTSGQQFVGAIFNHKDPCVNFRPVPEHNLLPHLKEILWGYDAQIYFGGGSGPRERRLMKVFVTEGVPEAEREFYEECLGAKGRQKLMRYTDKGIEPYVGIVRSQSNDSRLFLKSHTLRDTALELKKHLIRKREAEKAIFVAEKILKNNEAKLAEADKKLGQILVPENKNQLIQQTLKERRQNG